MPDSKTVVDRAFRSARLWSNHELRRFGPLFRGAVINVSGADDEDKEGGHYADYFPAKGSYAISNYSPGAYRGYKGRPAELLLDLCQPLDEQLVNAFDVVFNHTTLEHISDFKAAFRNLCLLTSDLVIVVVPFSQKQHETPGYQDFWRFTPTGIRSLFADNGLSVVYESESSDLDAAIYLFVVGTKNSDKWAGKFPANDPLTNAGAWIGAPSPPRPPGMIRRLFSRVRLRC